MKIRKEHIIKWLSALCFFICLSIPCHAQTWSEWFKQRSTQRKYLLLQIAKLKVYLDYVKKGNEIVHRGLDLIGDIKHGDLTLHTIFFDHLKQVSSTVRNSSKIADIIRMQAIMVAAYKSNYKVLKQTGQLSPAEIDYLYHVFTNLLDQLSRDIEVLTDVVTDEKLEMSDDERLLRIDAVYNSVTGKYNALFSFINQVHTLSEQRKKELNDLETLKKMYQP